MVIKPNSTSSNTQINIVERDIIALILEFLEVRKLNISQIALERETGIVNGNLSEEVLFLRNLITDGLWDDAVEYVEPLAESAQFDYSRFKKIALRYKYLELLCIKSEVGNVNFSDDAAIACLRDLETVCDRHEFNEYRLLLSYPRIQDHPDYADWNPSSARIRCFTEIKPLVDKVLQMEHTERSPTCIPAPENRLVHLVIKGILYETAGRLCAQRAKKQSDDLRFSSLLPKSSSPPEMTLLSWLQVIPTDTFTCKFEEKNLPLNYQKFDKPLLEASWTDVIQSSPIRAAKQPTESTSARMHIEDRMVQSMVEQMDDFRKKGVGSQSARTRGMSQSFHLGGIGMEDPFVSEMFAATTTPKSSRPGSSSGSARNHDSSIKESPAHGEKEDQPLYQNTPSNAETPSVPPLPIYSDIRPNYGEPLSPVHENASENDGYETPISHMTPKAATSREERSNTDTERKRLQSEWEERERQRQSLIAQILQTPGPTSQPSSTSVQSTPGFGDSSSSTNGDPTSPLKPTKANLISPLNNLEPATPVPHWIAPQLEAGDSPVVKYRLDDTPESNRSRQETPRTAGDSAVSVPQSANRPGSAASSSTVNLPSSRLVFSPDSIMTNDANKAPHSARSVGPEGAPKSGNDVEKRFVRAQVVEDSMFVRCAAFHPSGDFYAVGSNSRVLRICSYPKEPVERCSPAPIVDHRSAYHRGALYCMAWNPSGSILATGSNDKTVKLCRFNAENRCIEDMNQEMRFHDDAIRDLIFMYDMRSSTDVLVSASADSKIGITDCSTGTCFQKLTGHSATVLSLYSWGSSLFVSGSQDRTCRLWDLRSLSSTTAITVQGGLPASEVTSVRVTKDGRLLISAHENGQCMLWDLKAGKPVQVWQAHKKEIRGISLSPKNNLLLTGSYDKTVSLHNLEGNLYDPLPAFTAAEHDDKVIQCHFHTRDMAFLTTSADKTCVLWTYADASD